ncbi:DNA-directed RNA polymerase subunit omega [Fervidibacter sacchari]|uniref:DNA-directed RNA polymerase subunit omega n=1 Tax=Candidatus Fervidibacter sacchari TaxID=1448929 RepID=A0ABT2EQE6_9BACT|nr:DNA-directed RNA polymerase subunit omega [Candidatus Fervidibacter sacchari]MCS3920182.1 DNA-directed RNA polymerase subunit K/omega [Candidatus Fervidibacter sacchari]WKU14850.1 DNA-directed RNA polymerase subunit omega [Candidatus Fervidibacter sacchari]
MEQERELSVPESVLLNDLQYQLNRLPEGMRSKFLLVLAVSERARQIVESPERERSDENPVTRALREISEGRFQLRVTDEHFLRALQGKPEDTDIFPYRP